MSKTITPKTQKVTHTVLKPTYYDKFACIHSACEDNCCRGWRIFIDKKTYELYQSIEDPEFQKKQKECVKLVKGLDATEFHYAEFIFDNPGRVCIFLAENNLCEIHRDYGPEYLSKTCMVYPRLKRNMIPDYMELSVSMSCPPAVPVALFDKNPMEFVVEKMEFDANNPLLSGSNKPEEGFTGTNYIKYGWQMREAAITIMQIRTCPVAYRLIIIAMMLDDVVKAHNEDRAGDIPQILDYYSQATYGEDFVNDLKSMEPNDDIGMRLTGFLYPKLESCSKLPKYPRCKDFIDRYKEYCENKGFSDDEALYMPNFYEYIKGKTDKYWDIFLQEWEHVLENYLVNYMFAELFPLGSHKKGLDPYRHTFILADQYAVMRMLFCGLYDEKTGFDEKFVIHIVAFVANMAQHSSNPLKIAENYRVAGVGTPMHLYYLLLQ